MFGSHWVVVVHRLLWLYGFLWLSMAFYGFMALWLYGLQRMGYEIWIIMDYYGVMGLIGVMGFLASS